MPTSNKLREAQLNKADEFYTAYDTIDKEVIHYLQFIKGKRIYCPCDDYRISNFVRYLKDHYDEFELKGLTSTCFLFGEKGKRYEYDGKEETITDMEGDGDYRSAECRAIFDDCDIVMTNPPFSLMRDFVLRLIKMKKQYLILGPFTFLTTKMGYTAFKKQDIWTGVSTKSGGVVFEIPSDYTLDGDTKIRKGRKTIHLGNIKWYTNIGEPVVRPLEMTKRYEPSKYPYYANASAIHVESIRDIPYDFYGLMGVPITILDGFDSKTFELKGMKYGYDGKALKLPDGTQPFTRIIIKRKGNGS